MKAYKIVCLIYLNLLIDIPVFSQKISPIVHDKDNKTITLSDSAGTLTLRVNYSGGCILDRVIVKGHEVTGDGNVVFSEACNPVPLIFLAGEKRI